MFAPPRYAFIALDGRKSSDELYSKLTDFGSVRVLSRLSELSALFNELVCTTERQWEISLAVAQSFQQSTVPPINSAAPSVQGSYVQVEHALTRPVDPINNPKPPIDKTTVSEQSIGQISKQVVDTVAHRTPDGIPTINVATVSEHPIDNGTVEVKEEVIAEEEPEIITLGHRINHKQVLKRLRAKEESINEQEGIDMPNSDRTSTTASSEFNQNARNDYAGEGSSSKRIRIDEPINPQLVQDESIDGQDKAECRLCCAVFAVSHMKSHANTHNPRGDFCCPVDDCAFSTFRRDEVTIHYRRMHNMPFDMPPVNLRKPGRSVIDRARAIKVQREQKVVECFPTFFIGSVNGTVKRIG